MTALQPGPDVPALRTDLTPALAEEVARRLRAAGVQDVRTETVHRAAYTSDASLYRLAPLAVVAPRHTEDVHAVLAVARELAVPLTARGGGTSVAGNSLGRGLVMDFSRHLNQVLEIDPGTQTARVQPGVVQAQLQRLAAPHGLRFGPDPSTSNRCTIGGMIGNDACGSRSLAYGRTADNVEALTLLTGTGEELRTRRGSDPVGFESGLQDLRRLVEANLGALRTELGTFGRQISGYALHQALPENGFDVTRMLVGSEGTLGVITEATVRLVSDPAHRVLVVLGYTDMPSAADQIMPILEWQPSACEGLDARIVEVVRSRRGAHAVPDLPPGQAWLFVELSGEDAEELRDRAERFARSIGGAEARVVIDPAEAATLWKIRADGGGLAGRAPSGKPAHAGWEDAAVPPAALGSYLRDFEELLTEHDLTAMPFGHFGDGCVHVRLDFALDAPDGPQRFRAFMEGAGALIGRYGGSLSGEHGDGRARSDLLPHMYSEQVLAAFSGLKGIFDPQGVLNPGVIVDPEPLDESLRVATAHQPRTKLAWAYADDDGDFRQAVHRCTGVGKCRSVEQGPGTVMCPSYAATKDEKDSTRGRARLLQEMLNGELVDGWKDPALHEALDLCLSCKGCASDCPTGVDMATWKAEVTHQTYKGKRRPRSHYTLGRLPRWSKLASKAPRLANAGTKLPGVRRLALWAAGVDQRRSVPAFARRTFRTLDRGRTAGTGKPVVLFVDSFTNHFAPEVAQDMVRVLVDAGYAPRLTHEDVCCGLTWISTGQLDEAKRILTRSVALLAEDARAGIPIVGIEPSCTAALRHDAVGLLASEDAAQVAGAVRTLAELLASDDAWTPPDLSGTTVVAQPHCHHHAVIGWQADQKLLARTGVTIKQLGGCCGLAGNFGVEKGHYEVSVAVAELQLLPALADEPDAVYLADGFSCRTQASDLAERDGVHLAQLLAGALDRR